MKHILSVLMISLVLIQPALAAKKYKRALVIAGGSITPAIGIGVMQALREQGQTPDVVITTCGSSLSSAILGAYPEPKDALAFAKSKRFFDFLSEIKIAVPNALPMVKTFDWLEKNPDLYPPVYENYLMRFRTNTEGLLPRNQFPAGDQPGPRFIIQASKALFKNSDVGHRRGNGPLFQQVYFTDADTAESLRGIKSAVKKIFPKATVADDVEVRSDVSMELAARGGVTDPFLLNPAVINGEYFFTGAIDLFPMELAHEIADEVITTYPAALYQGYQDTAVESAFGFKQTDRALRAIQTTDVKWIDMSGIAAVNFEPTPRLIFLKNQIPENLKDFGTGIQKQYDFGYNRAKEALKAQAKRKNVRTHLREPINPKLYESYTCANANVWKTPRNGRCESDSWTGCDRQTEEVCTPIR